MIQRLAVQAKKRLLLAMKRGVAMTLRWSVFTGGAVDATTGARTGGTISIEEETVFGFYHPIDVAKTVVRQFEKLEVGDALVDVPPDTVIEGRDQLTFEIDGKSYEQKDIGDGKYAVTYEWMEGVRMYRTLILRVRP
jgi:hypothetical protein